MPWVSLGIFMLGLNQYLHKYWELNEQTNIILYLNFIAALSNVILNIIFIPIYGFLAAGITTFISYIIYFIIALVLLRDDFKINVFNKNLFFITFSSLLMLIPVYYLNNLLSQSILSFILIVFSGAFFYFILLYIFKIIRQEVKSLIHLF